MGAQRNKTIAIIPARGGSKRIPDKNIRLFCGKPIISYSISTALRSKLFDKVIVSTDSERIASVAKEYGADVPFIRPAELADDYSGIDSVILHALDWLDGKGESGQYACCIHATAPLMQVSSLQEGFKILKAVGGTSVFSVAEYPAPVLRSLKIDKTGRVAPYWPDSFKMRSQDLPAAYHDAGQFYWIDVDKYRTVKRMCGEDSYAITLPRHTVQDIDSKCDWQMAELLYRLINESPSLLSGNVDVL